MNPPPGADVQNGDTAVASWPFTPSVGRHVSTWLGRSICQRLAGFGIFRQTVHCPVPGQPCLAPGVTRRRNLARFIERAGRNINQVGRFGVCVSQWRSAITAKGAKNPWAGFKRLWCAVYPAQSAPAYTEPGNRWRCRYLPACGAVAKRRVERTRMNLIPDGTAIASTCQHRIPRSVYRSGTDCRQSIPGVLAHELGYLCSLAVPIHSIVVKARCQLGDCDAHSLKLGPP